MNDTDKRALRELTSLPTAAGCEHAAIAWVRRWAKRRRWVRLREDKLGNLFLEANDANQKKRRAPVILAAHMDHPAFVVEAVDGTAVTASFRGGVKESFFVGSAVRHWSGVTRGGRGTVQTYQRDGDADPRVTIRMTRPTAGETGPIRVGDVLTWDLPAASFTKGRLHAPVCDNLVGVFAALHAFARWHAKRGKCGAEGGEMRVLLTRAEEVGFVGAIGVCKDRGLPKDADVVVLEMSKSFADSPIGGGPIVRVGDATRTFDPALTARLAEAARGLAERDPAFRWQRRLMPGGTCEATAYAAYGYRAGCVCLALGNYHNMDEPRSVVARECIDLADLERMIRLLSSLPAGPGVAAVSIRARLDRRYADRRAMLAELNGP